MGLLDELGSQRRLLATCPSCEAEFRLADARLFDATKRLPPYVRDYLTEKHAELDGERTELRDKKKAARQRPRIAAQATNIGQVVEQLAPSLPGFPAVTGDCRSLFRPVDYVIFHGLSTQGRINSLTFVDVKSGRGRLSGAQSQVRSLVECGKVRLIIEDHRGGGR